MVRLMRQFLLITPINENGAAARVPTALHISPAITNHERVCEINCESFSCGKHTSRARLPATALFTEFGSSMIADFDRVDRQVSQHRLVDSFHYFFLEYT